ncbi:MAG TPA: flagellar biosynthetic protein FliR [Myxococcota bacterium]|nr:flagellar biosynthetic protein FliR [Myxococcota bacterium]HRY92520.1 flagellar biosynthetic protein FliR [Myxococcota bacterium]HSA24213.1 flagellar biosynthetic protein FliR [Myxococcota bacterium]
MGAAALDLLGLWGLVTARLLPAILCLPPLGGAHLPRPVQLGLAGVLAAALLPAGGPVPVLPGLGVYLGLLLKELGLGAVLAVAGLALVEALRAGGRLADDLRGAGQAPGGAGDSGDTPLARLHGLLACLAFFALGGPEAGLRVLGASLVRLPPLAWPDGAALEAGARLAVGAFATAFELAMAVAFPAALAGLGVDLVLGWVGRSAPGLPVHFVAAPLRAVLALGAVALALEPNLAAWIRRVAGLLGG